MRTQTRTQLTFKARGPSRANTQQVAFELKHKVVCCLNKLSDRDTYQIGVAELEKMAEALTSDGISSFLSCILDTDAEQKNAVRKECIRLMGTLAKFHDHLLSPHLNKIIASIVKRLKDPDSVVRDACAETVGVLASKLGHSDGVFVALVRPLFESLGEQNKQVQSGSALCLARVIDNTQNPPISILQRLLTRTTKLIKNPHFMAKPALLDLNRSIIQGGGATTRNLLCAAISAMQEALKDREWMTRKAASVALAEIALSGGSFVGTLKASCIHTLESCRFDKVKPVRDTVLQALQHWRSLPSPGTPEPSEAGSSIKADQSTNQKLSTENYCTGDYSDISSVTESGRKDATVGSVCLDSSKRRTPFSARKTCQNFGRSPQHSKEDWQIEIAVPKNHHISLCDHQNDESEGSSVTKTLDRMSTDIASVHDIGYDYVPMDDKHESPSVSDIATNKIDSKSKIVRRDCLKDSSLLKTIGRSQHFVAEETSVQDEIYLAKLHDRNSLDSTVTESSPQMAHACSLMESEMSSIRKQLLEIERKQTSLMDMLRGFATTVSDGLSTVQSKVLDLELLIDRMAQELAFGGRYSHSVCSTVTRQSQNISSPRHSTSTPRPSVDLSNGKPSLLSMKNSKTSEAKACGKGRLNKQDAQIWTEPMVKTNRNPMGNYIEKSFMTGAQSMACHQLRNRSGVLTSAASNGVRTNIMDSKGSPWEQVKCFLSKGDLDSAYMAAVFSGDELLFIDLTNRTGPVLEKLSPQTAGDVLSTLASYFHEQKFTNSIIPWLQQLVDLSTIHGPDYLFFSAKTRRELLSVVQQLVNIEFPSPKERKSVAQLAIKLHQLCGQCM